MTNVRAFVRHWAAALIVAAVFVVAGVALLGVKVVGDRHHEAEVDRNSSQIGACAARKALQPHPGKNGMDLIADCILEVGD